MLTQLTLAVVAAIVVALAGYLIATAWLLNRARAHVAAIADGLEAVQRDTAPLPEKLPAINAALVSLRDGLKAADGHLGRAARVFRL